MLFSAPSIRRVCSADTLRRTAAASGWRRAPAELDEDVRRRHADLESVQVAPARAWRGARCRNCGCRSRKCRVQRGPGRETTQDFAPRRAVHCAPHVRRRIEHEGQGGDARGGEGVVERREIHAREVDDVVAHQVHGIAFATELARVVHTDAKAARSLLRQLFADPAHGLHGRIAVDVRVRRRQTVAGSRAAPMSTGNAPSTNLRRSSKRTPPAGIDDQPGVARHARGHPVRRASEAHPAAFTRPDVVNPRRCTGRHELTRSQRLAVPRAPAECERQAASGPPGNVAAPPSPTSWPSISSGRCRCGRSPATTRATPAQPAVRRCCRNQR